MGRKKIYEPNMSWRMKQFIKEPWASRLRAERISMEPGLSEEFIDKYNRYLDWYKISAYQQMSEKFIEDHYNRVHIRFVLERGLISEDFIRRHEGELAWRDISSSKANFSKDFMREFKEKFNWDYYMFNHKVDEKFVEEFKDKIDWGTVLQKANLSEPFIKKWMVEMDKASYNFWNSLCQNQKLSEKFIEEYANKIDWKTISYSQNLSEKFIREHADKFEWRYIIQRQKLSEDFLREFACPYLIALDHWEWTNMIKSNKVSRKFLKTYKKYFNWQNLKNVWNRVEINREKGATTTEYDNWATKLDMKFIMDMIEKTGQKN